MTRVKTETETVIKRILPYLRRRGYDPETHIDFETAVNLRTRFSRGYVDLLVTHGKSKPQFLIEAKRSGKSLNESDRKQALEYGRELEVPFVVVTNGADVQCLNAVTGQAILWDGKLIGKVPRADQLAKVVRYLRANKHASVVLLAGDDSLPFRPGLPLKQLNAMFAKCHNQIRNIEKNEEHAFADFSKLLFLKLLEERHDEGTFDLGYSYRFHELADRRESDADQVKDAIIKMLDDIGKRGYGDVLGDPLHLKKPKTFHFLVKQLSAVSFEDSGLDSKGAAFEYFVRATLKGKRLGQYFTPRELVDLMVGMIGRHAVLNSLSAGVPVKVVDPACGTGGFLVFMMKSALAELDERTARRSLTRAASARIRARLMNEVFFGADANPGVASAAKMNMIVAGSDGHTNISVEDTLGAAAKTWNFHEPTYDFVVTNPPFGTSEKASLAAKDLARYPVAGTKGQNLFLQRMVLATKPGGRICTVIDEGLLNTGSSAALRRWALCNARLLAVVQLPDDTFKPNKINVKSSVLLLERRDQEIDPTDMDSHPVVFCKLDSLGYLGSGDKVRGFDLDRLRSELDQQLLNYLAPTRKGYHWSAFQVDSLELMSDSGCRWDLKYWEPATRARIESLQARGALPIAQINIIPTRRGKSPAASSYVDEADDHALVVKAGSSITKFGELDISDSDYIEKHVYDAMPDEIKLRKGDVLLASTGEGTLGKACVYTSTKTAIADGHITIIRVDQKQKQISPEFLCDYLRCGFGQEQIARYSTGSTGLIELTPEDVDRIVVDTSLGIKEQRAASARLRTAESRSRKKMDEANRDILQARANFAKG